MHDKFATVAGELSNWPTKERLAQLLIAAGHQIYVGRYSIRVEDCEHFSFEQFAGDLGEPCIVADAETTDQMVRDAQRVSHALAAANLRHRFEVYDGMDILAAYFHHEWPEEPQ